jgi:hypothetical protein
MCGESNKVSENDDEKEMRKSPKQLKRNKGAVANRTEGKGIPEWSSHHLLHTLSAHTALIFPLPPAHRESRLPTESP